MDSWMKTIDPANRRVVTAIQIVRDVSISHDGTRGHCPPDGIAVIFSVLSHIIMKIVCYTRSQLVHASYCHIPVDGFIWSIFNVHACWHDDQANPESQTSGSGTLDVESYSYDSYLTCSCGNNAASIYSANRCWHNARPFLHFEVHQGSLRLPATSHQETVSTSKYHTRYFYNCSVQNCRERRRYFGDPEMCYVQSSHDFGNALILDLIPGNTQSVAVSEKQEQTVL